MEYSKIVIMMHDAHHPTGFNVRYSEDGVTAAPADGTRVLREGGEGGKEGGREVGRVR